MDIGKNWRVGLTTLNYYLGEKKLLSFSMPALILETHFAHLDADPLQPSPPFEKLGDVADVIVTRSHPIEATLPMVTRMPCAIRYVPKQYRRYHVGLDQDFEAYMRKFSAKSRSTLQRKIRKFTEIAGGVLDWQVYRNEREIQDFYRMAREISVKTYQEKLLNAGLPESQQFQAQLQEWAKADDVRGYLLRSQDKPVAYILCPVRNGVVFYEFVGYDPDFQALSPGTVLQYFALQDLMGERRFSIFDFTEGEGQHKAFFSTHNALCADVYYFRPSVRSWALILAHVSWNGLMTGIVGLIDRMGMKARIKNLLRR